MRLRLIDRVRRYIRPRLAGPRSRGTAKAGPPASGTAIGSVSSVGAGRHRRTHQAAGGPATAAFPDSRSGLSPASGPAETPESPGPRPRAPEASVAGAPAGRPARPAGPAPGRPAEPAALPRRRPRPPQPGTPGAEPPWASPSGAAAGRALGLSGQERVAIRPAPGAPAIQAPAAQPQARAAERQASPAAAAAAAAARVPWYEVAHRRRAAEGSADCGPLERVLRREWPASVVPSPPVVLAVNRLAGLPLTIKNILAAGLEAIHVGEGGVPELDDMGRLRGVPLPSGRATWDACAGAYGKRKIIVGTRPSSAPDVMCHEVGHALDDIDRVEGGWQSDSAEFRRLYERCERTLVSDFHKQAGDLGRREFFADAFAAIASRQRPALVDMLGGNIRTALDVMLYFNLRYGL